MKKQTVLFWLLLSGVYLGAWFIQERLFLNWDVSYLLHAAKLLLAGGSYTQDFFTPNPPLILYLYLPPLLLKQLAGISLMGSVRVYLFLMASLSLALCDFFACRLFLQEPRAGAFLRRVFVLTLAVIFLWIPSYDFGQREHLLFMLTLPYLLLLACRLQAIPVQKNQAFVVGLLAGLGFALKPQFYLPFILLEFYYLLAKRQVFAWLRCETVTILALLALYSGLLVIYYPDYLWVVAPYVLRNFYGSLAEPWSQLLFNHLALFCCLPLFLSLLLYKKPPYRSLNTVLALGVLGYLGVYLAQHTLFYYHILPAFSLALLLQSFLFALFVSQPTYSWKDYGAAVATVLLGFALLFYQVRPIGLTLLFATHAFFCFFGVLFTFLLITSPQRRSALRMIASVACILALGFLCFYLAQRTSWSSHELILTIAVLLALFGLLAPRSQGGVGTSILTATLGMVLFAYPAFFSYCMYWKGLEYKEKVLNKLIVFMRAHAPHGSLYVFSLRGNYGSPLVDYTGGHLAQRFDCMWPVAGFVRRPVEGATLQKDKKIFIEMIAEDLRRGKPDLVFVDQWDAKMRHWDPGFRYLSFLAQSPRFREEWKDYRYLTTLHEAFLYELEVYQRIPGVPAEKRGNSFNG